MCQPWSQYVLYMLYDIIVLKPSTMFHVPMWPCDFFCNSVINVWQYDYDITLTLNLDLRVQKRKKKKKKKIK